MCSFFDPEQSLQKPFFDSVQIRDPGSRQSYFIRAHLCTNFEVTLDPEFARNQKIVLINVDQDAILYLWVNYQHVLKKFPNPSVK